jgi:hypothetical protein
MKIVGCDLHTRYQQIALLDTETGRVAHNCLRLAIVGFLRKLVRRAKKDPQPRSGLLPGAPGSPYLWANLGASPIPRDKRTEQEIHSKSIRVHPCKSAAARCPGFAPSLALTWVF